ncbi:Transient receptor potential channel pyrexia, partial [Orchesella cincta]
SSIVNVESDNQSPPSAIPELHKAAKSGDIEGLRNSLSFDVASASDLLEVHNGPKTSKRKSSEMIRAILRCYFLSEEEDALSNLLNLQHSDNNLKTALHIAAEHYNREAVIGLLFAGADVNLRDSKGVEPITLIYKNVPKAFLTIFDQHIRCKDESEDVDVSDEDLEIVVNFSAVVGLHGPVDDESRLINETELITTVITESSLDASDVLLHPLVRLFLHSKWNDTHLKHIIWFSIFFHIVWSILTTIYFVDLYLLNCPYIVPADAKDPTITCEYGMGPKIWGWILIVISSIIAVKEVYEFIACPRFWFYFKQLENIGQCVLLILMLITFLTSFFRTTTEEGHTRIYEWEYPIAAWATLVALTLILGQIGKDPRLGIYIEMLQSVCKRSAYFTLVYGPLFVAFWASFKILMPQQAGFGWPGFIKVVVMMTGETNYDDLFYGDEAASFVPFPVLSQLLFLILIMFVTIVMANLLIAILISDIQSLEHSSQLCSLKTQLQQINLMEAFLPSFLSSISLNTNTAKLRQRRFLVTQQSDDVDKAGFSKTISMLQIPRELQEAIREKVRQNMETASQS